MESGTWLAPRFALITCTQKLPDRFVFTGSLPADPQAADPLLLITLEVRVPWQANSRLIATLTDVLAQRYPTLRRSTNPLQSFELALKNVNEELMGLAEAGETEWIGRLSGIIALVLGNEVHVAQTGDATAFLFRQRKISQISERQDARDPHPLTTFANIISGYTNAGDRIVFGNADIFNLLSLDFIRTAVTDQTPWQSVQTIARAVGRTKILSVSTAVLGVEQAKTWEELGAEPIVANLEEITQSWPKKAWKSLRPVLIAGQRQLQLAAGRTKELARSGQERWRSQVAPKAKEMIAKTGEAIKQRAETAPSPAEAAAKTQFSWALLNRQASAWEQGITLSVAAPFAQTLQALAAPLEKADYYISTASGRIKPLLKSNHGRWWIAAVAVLLIFLVYRSAVTQQRQIAVATQNQANEQQLTQALNKTDRLQSAIRLKQNKEATNLISDINTALDNLVEPTEEQTRQQAELRQRVQAAHDLLNNVTRVQPQQHFTLTATGTMLAVADEAFLVAAPDSSSGLLVARPDGTSRTYSLPAPPQAVSVDAERQSLVAVTSDGAVSSVKWNGGEPTVTALPSGSVPAGPIATFNRNLYLVADSALWRFSAAGEGYGSAVELARDATLENALAVAIDGAIYVLREGNVVDKYIRNRHDTAFTLKNLPADVSALTRLFTHQAAEELYLVDVERHQVLVVDKNGTYTKQYVLESDAKIVDIVIDSTSKRAYVLTPQEIEEYVL